MTRHILVVLAALTLLIPAGHAQEAPSTPFPYPVAPDTCSTLESRCNYIITRFWDNYNITRPIADDAAFETAFRDWVGFFPYCHRNIVMSTIRDFMFKAQSNTPNLIKIGAVAERALYSPEAEFWSDEVYIAFAQQMAAAKQLKNDLRSYYRDQIQRINANQEGMVLNVEYTGTDGQRHRLLDLGADGYILLLSDDGVDSTIDRVRLSTDVVINKLLDEGALAVVNIVDAKYNSQWATAAAGYPANWTVGCNDKLSQLLDLRALPVCYLIDKEGKILRKNITVEALKDAFNH